MKPLPIYCAGGNADHLADWLVDGPRGNRTACHGHLAKALRDCGPGAAQQPAPQPDDAHEQQNVLF